MASQLLIIGNGFDLHCGLKSGYADFFRSEILDTTTISFGIPQLQADCKGFWEELLLGYYIVNRNNDYNWCDIETIIKDTLWTICFGDGNIAADLDNGLGSKASRIAYLGQDPKYETNNITNPIIKFIIYYCSNFFYRTQRTLPLNTKLQLLLEHLLQELHNFEKRFCKYIKNNIVNHTTPYIVNAVNLLAELTNFSEPEYETLEDIIGSQMVTEMEQTSSNMLMSVHKKKNFLDDEFSALSNIHILSFNYTNLFDILEVENPCVHNNVHGKLCNAACEENCNSSNIIFGIDDVIIQSQNASSELRMFSKTYRKMFDTNAQTNTLPKNNNTPLEIKFYGHSLSSADYSYFQSIFDYYNLYSNSNISLIFYYSKGYEKNDDIYKLINTYGKTLSNQEQGKNLIHKLLLENRLMITPIK